MSAGVGVYVHMNAGVPKDQSCWIPVELEFTGSHEMLRQVLGWELNSSGRAASAFDC